MCRIEPLLSRTNHYELTLAEFKTIKWALLVLLSGKWATSADLTPDEIVELENRMLWRNE